MKKITMVVLAMLLVASIGQAASAKGSVGAFAGYHVTRSGFSVALNGEYEFVNWFSLAAEAEVTIGKDGIGDLFTGYSFDLEGKFTFLNIGKFNLGAKVFATADLVVHDMLFVGPGIYANVTLFEKLKVELDYGCSLLGVDFVTGAAGFLLLPYYADLRVSYALSDNISLGIRGKMRTLVIDVGLAFEYKF